jgi:protein-L-isoaspartate O-methyltransferase
MNMPDVAYILGHFPAEIGRLIFQASILKPITERLLREAGVAPGMRVLDLGCGTGDVALLVSALTAMTTSSPLRATAHAQRATRTLSFAKAPQRTLSIRCLSIWRLAVTFWSTRRIQQRSFARPRRMSGQMG